MSEIRTPTPPVLPHSALKPTFWTWEKIDGINYPNFIYPEWLEKAKTFPVRPGDVFVSTYPKSGSTWMSQIAHLILNKGNSEVPFQQLWVEAGGLPNHLGDSIYDFPDRRLLYGHGFYSNMPGGPPNTSPAKYIYVARNPKDVFVSYYHFHINLKEKMEFGRTWEEFFDLFIKGEVLFGSWWEHVPEWWSHRNEKNVLFLKYEDLKKDLPKGIELISEFLGCDLDQNTVHKITTMTSFEALKNSEIGQERPHMFRKGAIGDWIGQLSAEESATMDARYAEVLSGTGLQFDFGDL